MTPFEKIYRLMIKPQLILIYLILVILAYQYADRVVATYFYEIDVRKHASFLYVLTALGSMQVYAVLFFISGLYFRYFKVNREYEAKSWYLLSCILLVNMLGLVLKIMFGRARPDLLFNSHLFGFYWFKLHRFYWSFPSGHTITIISLASGLGVIFPKYFYMFLGAALVIASSRILLYHHYISDVMTAVYLSIIVVGIFTQYVRKKQLFYRV